MVNASVYSFDALCSPLFRELVGYARRLGSCEAEDLAQDAMLRALLSWPTWNPPGDKEPGKAARAWLYRIVTNLHINRVRDARGRNQKEVDHWHKVMECLYQEPSEGPVRQQLHPMVTQALSRLPARYRRVFEAYYLLEESCEQIAERMNMPSATVCTALRRARLRLRPLLTTFARNNYEMQAISPPPERGRYAVARSVSTVADRSASSSCIGATMAM